MKKVSDILKNVYLVEWNKITTLECGANTNGDETSDLIGVSNCWFMEANPHDYEILKKNKKNTINLALSNKNGNVEFNVCLGSGSGLSGIDFSAEHLNDLKILNVQYKTITVPSIRYDDLQIKHNIKIDVLILDIEGHEVKVLESFFEMSDEFLPKIIVIECGHDWEKRKEILNKLGYVEDCYYYNNCYLTRKKTEIIKNKDNLNIINEQWRTFKWGDKIIYINNL
jgi:FkbM family methyltransferase